MKHVQVCFNDVFAGGGSMFFSNYIILYPILMFVWSICTWIYYHFIKNCLEMLGTSTSLFDWIYLKGREINLFKTRYDLFPK
jgi:hypothetical protein